MVLAVLVIVTVVFKLVDGDVLVSSLSSVVMFSVVSVSVSVNTG